MGAFIVVAIVLCMWVAAFEYCIGGALARLRRPWMREHPEIVVPAMIGLPLAGLVILLAHLRESARLEGRPRPAWLARLRQLFETGLFTWLGVFLLVYGFVLLLSVLPAGKVLAMLFGAGFVGLAFTAGRRHRRWRQGLIDRGHPTTAVLYLPALPVLAAIGCLILALGL